MIEKVLFVAAVSFLFTIGVLLLLLLILANVWAFTNHKQHIVLSIGVLTLDMFIGFFVLLFHDLDD